MQKILSKNQPKAPKKEISIDYGFEDDSSSVAEPDMTRVDSKYFQVQGASVYHEDDERCKMYF